MMFFRRNSNQFQRNKRAVLAYGGRCAAMLTVLSLLAPVYSYAQSAVISKSRAVEIARDKFGGKPFGKIKELEKSDGSVTYEVRLDNAGRMIIVHVDGQGNASKK